MHSTFPTSLDVQYLQVNMKERGMINARSDHTATGNRHVNTLICLYRSHVLTCSSTVVFDAPRVGHSVHRRRNTMYGRNVHLSAYGLMSAPETLDEILYFGMGELRQKLSLKSEF